MSFVRLCLVSLSLAISASACEPCVLVDPTSTSTEKAINKMFEANMKATARVFRSSVLSNYRATPSIRSSSLKSTALLLEFKGELIKLEDAELFIIQKIEKNK